MGFDDKLWANFENPVQFPTFVLWLLRKLMGDERYERVRELYEKEETHEKLSDAAIALLQQGRYLLVMDNLETLQQDDLWQPFQRFLEKWLRSGSTSKVLLTTQAKVALCRAEAWEWLQVGRLETIQGVQLLKAFGVEGSEAELEEYVEIAEGHPLLLRLSASYLIQSKKLNGERASIHRLQRDDLTLLREICDAHRGDPQASVGKVLDRSLSLLEPATLRVLLLRLAVLQKSFRLPIAQGMIDEPLALDELRKLARWSFVQERRDGEDWQFSFLPLVKRYLMQRCRMEEQEQIGHERAISYFTSKIKPEKMSIEDCAEELEIFHHRCELGEHDLAKNTLDTCVAFLDRRGYYQDLLLIYERLTRDWTLKILDNIGEERHLGSAWMRLGVLYKSVGQYHQAIAAYNQAQFFFSSSDFLEDKANLLLNLGTAYHSLGQYQEAIEYCQKSLKIKRDINDHGGKADALCNLGGIYLSLGQHQQAIDLFKQGIEIKRSVGDRNGEATFLGNLGTAYYSLGQYHQAITLYEQSLEIKRDYGYRNSEAGFLGNLGNAYFWLGQYQRVIDLYEQSLEIQRNVGDRCGEAGSLSNLGNVHNALGQYKQAVKVCKQSLKIQREIGHRRGQAACLATLGNAYRSLERYSRAIDACLQSLAIDRDLRNRDGEASTLCNLGNIYTKLEQYQQAVEYYQQSLKVQYKVGNRTAESICVGNLGSAYHQMGQYQQAIDCYQQSLDIQREIGHRHGEGVVLFNKALVLLEYESRRFEAFAAFQQARAIFSELKLESMVERCNEKIYSFNRIISTEQRQSAPTITPDPIIGNPPAPDDWYERSLPTPAKPRQTSPRQINWVLWFCVGLAIVLLIAWLRR